MARLCERPGCSAPADVAYGFDAELLIVWLDGFHAAQGARSGVLCRRHAEAMVVPLGWMLDDRRDPVPRLFRAPAEAPARTRPRRARTERAGDSEQLELDVTAPVARPDVSGAGQSDVELDHDADGDDPVRPWQPVFDQTDDLSGLLNARGRLLSRAFHGLGPDRS